MLKKLFLMLSIVAIFNCWSRGPVQIEPKNDPHNWKNATVCTWPSDSTMCYCSFKCGLRKIEREKGDDPRKTYAIHNGEIRTDLGLHCFCKLRDAKNFVKNNCCVEDPKYSQCSQ